MSETRVNRKGIGVGGQDLGSAVMRIVMTRCREDGDLMAAYDYLDEGVWIVVGTGTHGVGKVGLAEG